MARSKNDEQNELNLRELKSNLKEKNPGRMYVFFGEEEYLKSYYLEQIKKQILQGPAGEFNFHKFTSENFSVAVLQDAIDSFPMMAERSMVLLNDIDFFKASEEIRTQITEILRDLPDHICIVLYYSGNGFNPDKRQKKLYEAICGAGLVVRFDKQTEHDVCAWIARHFATEGKRIEEKNCSYLYFITGGLMNSIASEISKICAYAEHEVIIREDIDAVVEPVLDAIVFQITDAISEGRFGVAVSFLQQILKQQEDPTAVLGAISAHFRRIRMAKVLIANGQRASDLCELAGIGMYPAQKLVDAAARCSDRFCGRAVVLCEETDNKMKLSVDEPDALLEILLIRLSEEYRHG